MWRLLQLSLSLYCLRLLRPMVKAPTLCPSDAAMCRCDGLWVDSSACETWSCYLARDSWSASVLFSCSRDAIDVFSLVSYSIAVSTHVKWVELTMLGAVSIEVFKVLISRVSLLIRSVASMQSRHVYLLLPGHFSRLFWSWPKYMCFLRMLTYSLAFMVPGFTWLSIASSSSRDSPDGWRLSVSGNVSLGETLL
jgi:hypothetical protein